jgi:uncharacterized protein YbcC (UPF0753/DUF2309 family)
MNTDQVSVQLFDLDIDSALSRVARLIPPLWTLRDLVAVNPFLGYSDMPVVDAHERVKLTLGADLLPTFELFAEYFKRGAFNISHLNAVSNDNSSPTPAEIIRILEEINCGRSNANRNTGEVNSKVGIRSFAGWLDYKAQTRSKWKADVLTDISRLLATRYDMGVAYWSGFKEGDLYSAWRRYSTVSRAMAARGAADFHHFVGSLPHRSSEAVKVLINELRFQRQDQLENYLSCLIGELPGWSGYLRQRVWHSTPDDLGELPDLICIRLAYDIGLMLDTRVKKSPGDVREFFNSLVIRRQDISRNTKARMLLLQATELAYREGLSRKLNKLPKLPERQGRPSVQAIFCIDVRSELLRRHLSSLDLSISTHGFAGFFGLPLGIRDIDGSVKPQCPVLIEPALAASPIDSHDPSAFRSIKSRVRAISSLLTSVSRSANSNFSYVETLGLASICRFLGDLFALSKPAKPTFGLVSFTESNKTQLADYAAGILNHLGLSQPFARIVLFCGHGASVANNPQEAALACGACGGHSGAVNAAAAAQILNDVEIRELLHERGWIIPKDTLFVGAVHDTVSDAITIQENVPVSHQYEVSQLDLKLREALLLVRAEKAPRLGIHKTNGQDILRNVLVRTADIAEVRPEWALAGNAAFFIARSEQLRSVDLEGRCFLHHYDQDLDPNGAVLETILTAPVIVASWINLQYFGSTSDPRRFGSGLKTIHNICGGIGVVAGNDGDLEAGLSFQSVHDGVNFQHQPLRLQVYIQSEQSQIDRILSKHQSLNNLVRNGWIFFHRLDKDAIPVH